MSRPVLPGFRRTLAFTTAYLLVLVVVPLAFCVARAATLSPAAFLAAAWSPRAQAAYRLTIGASFLAAAINVVAGTLLAWVLVRYRFPGRRLMDAMVDLPFALPTAVAGLVFSDLFAARGLLGQHLAPLGIEVAYTRLGVVLVLVFVGLPFVVRTVQPVLESLDPEVEEAAAALGAGRLMTFRKVLLPTILPAMLTGFALAFARALGEYGSVVFIAPAKPFDTEIAPVLIVARLEEYKYAEAAALATVLLGLSFLCLAAINGLDRWRRRDDG